MYYELLPHQDTETIEYPSQPELEGVLGMVGAAERRARGGTDPGGRRKRRWVEYLGEDGRVG